MWMCPYCGNNGGVKFKDLNLKGMLCMHPDCGRFDEMNEVNFEQLEQLDINEESLV